MNKKLSDIPKDILYEIFDLEYKILPVLRASGINIDKKNIRDEILKDPDQIVITFIKDFKLRGVCRYNKNGSHIFIKSLHIDKKNNNILPLLGLGREFYTNLEQEALNKVESVVQISNTRSLNFHKKLGFEVLHKTDKAIRFKIEKKKLLTRIKRFLKI